MGQEHHDHGQRLIPVLIDEIASSDPQRPFFAVPHTNDPQDGFQDITYKSFAQAVHRCSWWLESQLGRSSTFETVTYFGHAHDILYILLILAAVKTGHKALLGSPRNSLEAHLSLIDQTGCRIILVQQEPPSFVSQILRNRQMQAVPVPPLHHFLVPDNDCQASKDISPYPFAETFDEARYDPFVVFQTSGSTGIPKPVVMAHGTFTALDAHQLILELGGDTTTSEYLKGSRCFNGFPHYHTGFYLYLLGFGIFCSITTVLAPLRPLTASFLNSLQIHGACTGLVSPPSLLEDIAKDPVFLSDTAKLKYIVFAGGPLDRNAGNRIASMTKLLNWFGSTEAGMYPMVAHDGDWEYVEFSPFLGHDLRHIDNDLFELVLVRREGLEIFQGIFYTYPELQEYPTRDLYSSHPSLPKLWKNRGRVDDIIAFSNAEKFNPIDMERSVCAHPAVKGAIVAGQGRFQASLLVEPVMHAANRKAEQSLLEEIWATIEEANRHCVAQGRVEKHLVIFTSPSKPMLKTGKGTIRRRPTISQYEKELDAMYLAADVDAGKSRALVDPRQPCNGESLDSFLLKIFSEQAGGKEMSVDEDIWSLGLDSLHVAAMVKAINGYMTSHGRLSSGIILNEDLYVCPTISRLSAKLTEVEGIAIDFGNTSFDSQNRVP